VFPCDPAGVVVGVVGELVVVVVGLVVLAVVGDAVVGGAVVTSSVGVCVVVVVEHSQCVAGQFVGQLATHHASMLAWPTQAPAALQVVDVPPVTGASVTASSVGVSVASVVGASVASVVGASVMAPPVLPSLVIATSAQFQNASGYE